MRYGQTCTISLKHSIRQGAVQLYELEVRIGEALYLVALRYSALRQCAIDDILGQFLCVTPMRSRAFSDVNVQVSMPWRMLISYRRCISTPHFFSPNHPTSYFLMNAFKSIIPFTVYEFLARKNSDDLPHFIPVIIRIRIIILPFDVMDLHNYAIIILS